VPVVIPSSHLLRLIGQVASLFCPGEAPEISRIFSRPFQTYKQNSKTFQDSKKKSGTFHDVVTLVVKESKKFTDQ